MSTAAQPAPGPVGVIGLWHLGSVTAACLAQAGNDVIALDPDAAVAEQLQQGRPPISEPGLAELIAEGIAAGRLRFGSEPHALRDARLAWVTFDTPVDEDDRADVEQVLELAERMLSGLAQDTLVVVSSQLPVGSCERLRARCARRGDRGVRVACIPENLRLGQALDSFRSPERFVVGVREERDRAELAALLAPFTTNIEWMGVESAEMTKHAVNGFLATSVAFINELASICERVGADAGEVARGLKSERRIGPRAYLSPGEAFAGGTLARDVGFLRELAAQHGLPSHLFSGVAEGNAAHKRWSERKLLELLGGERADRSLAGATVAVWGLTYKPGTDTLRRSSAVELCHWLLARGATVRAHDPSLSLSAHPPELDAAVELCASPLAALEGADALVLCTPWSEYRDPDPERLLSLMASPTVIDPSALLAAGLAEHPAFRYVRVGSAGRVDATDTEMAARP